MRAASVGTYSEYQHPPPDLFCPGAVRLLALTVRRA